MRPYASRPVRAALQLVGDLALLAWTAVWITVAVAVHGAFARVGSAGYRLRDGAGGVAGRLGEAGDAAAKVPLAGDALATPLRSAGGAASDVAGAGGQFGDNLAAVALPLALALVAAGVAPVAVPWVASRVRWARLAGTAVALAGSPAGDRLLALRALAACPPRSLVAVDPDPAAAWSDGDPEVTRALAAVELHRLGVARRPRRRTKTA